MRLNNSFIALTVCLSATVLAFNLECANLYQHKWLEVGKVFTCEVQNLEITQEGETMDVSSAVAEFNEVKALSIQSQDVHFMPTFFVEFDKRLECFEIIDCHIRTIDRSDLKHFPNLKFLDLSQNDLESLPSDLFRSSRKLKFIRFDDNTLLFVGQNILSPLSDIMQAWFRKTCTDSYADEPEKIETLKTSLIVNCAEDKKQIGFDANNDLEKKIGDFELHLKHQKVKSTIESTGIEERFGGSDAGQTLQLKVGELKNENEQLQHKLRTYRKNLEGAAKNLVNLLSKSCSTQEKFDDSLDVVCEKFLQEDRCVVADLIIANPHTELGIIIDKNGVEVQPRSLIIRDQAVLFLPVRVSGALPDLEELEISNSGIFVIDKNCFVSLKVLKLLNMSGNFISTIPALAFFELKKLTELDLSHNNIDQIERNAWKGLGELKVLMLNHNKLVNIAATFQLKSLKLLDLSSNIIESLPKYFFKQLTKLAELRLSFNDIKILNADFLPETNAIEVFKIDNNKLEEVDTQILLVLEDSNVIDLTECGCVDVKFSKVLDTSETALRAIFVGTSCLVT